MTMALRIPQIRITRMAMSGIEALSKVTNILVFSNGLIIRPATLLKRADKIIAPVNYRGVITSSQAGRTNELASFSMLADAVQLFRLIVAFRQREPFRKPPLERKICCCS